MGLTAWRKPNGEGRWETHNETGIARRTTPRVSTEFLRRLPLRRKAMTKNAGRTVPLAPGLYHADGNARCARCHLPAKFDATEHHHHQPGNAGAQCVKCHMPSSNGRRRTA